MSSPTTIILQRLSGGDLEALDELIPRVYEELKNVARQHLAGETQLDGFQSTALVHEAYLRLVDQRVANWQDKAHFLAIASTVMRRILLDQIRSRNAAKRGGGQATIQLITSSDLRNSVDPVDLLALDEVLRRLESLNARHAKIVEMRFFGGLTIKEAAKALNLSEATVKNDWRTARAWLAVEMDE